MTPNEPDLPELVSEITDQNRHDEIEVGSSVGAEVTLSEADVDAFQRALDDPAEMSAVLRALFAESAPKER